MLRMVLTKGFYNRGPDVCTSGEQLQLGSVVDELEDVVRKLDRDRSGPQIVPRGKD